MRATLVYATLVLSCVPAPQQRERTAPIVNGTPDSGDLATVFLDLGGGSCSGTLIAPHVVLTAKHCTTDGGQIRAFFGSDSSGQGTWIDVNDVQQNPDGDISVLRLAMAGPTPPKPIVNVALADSMIGQAVRIVGFGVTTENGSDSGLKRQGTTPLDELQGDTIYIGRIGSKTCYGDSGGPYFMTLGGTEYVVGVTSFGESTCDQGRSGGTRVDTYHDWIANYINMVDPGGSGGAGGAGGGGGSGGSGGSGGGDMIPPQVSVTSPADGATVPASFEIEVATSDNSGTVAKVDFLADGQVLAELTAPPWTFTVPGGRLPQGAHALSARATDPSGNMATSAVVHVTVQATGGGSGGSGGGGNPAPGGDVGGGCSVAPHAPAAPMLVLLLWPALRIGSNRRRGRSPCRPPA